MLLDFFQSALCNGQMLHYHVHECIGFLVEEFVSRGRV